MQESAANATDLLLLTCIEAMSFNCKNALLGLPRIPVSTKGHSRALVGLSHVGQAKQGALTQQTSTAIMLFRGMGCLKSAKLVSEATQREGSLCLCYMAAVVEMLLA